MSHPLLERSWESVQTLEPWLERGRELLARLVTLLVHGTRRAGKRLAGGSPILRQGLAALERGNLEAAFWLLREEVGRQPDETRAVQAFWDAAVACGRAEAAAAAMGRQVERQAGEDAEVAAGTWITLEMAAPDTPLDALTLARLLPALKARLAAAAGEEVRAEARQWLGRALRRCVEPGSGLAGGVALRVFEEARELEPEAARHAAEIALASPHLHEAKRARLEAHLAASPQPAVGRTGE